MRKKQSTADTKEKILTAARDIFIENGYDKTKMDDIAAKAQVNKVMLYYHFKSKENILKELISKIIENAKIKLSEALESLKNEKKILPELLVAKLDETIGQEKAFIRLILSEVLRKNVDANLVMGLLKAFYDAIFEMMKRDVQNNEDKEEFIVKMLFFQGIPLIMFYSLSEEISMGYGIDMKKIKKVFIEKFSDSLLRTVHQEIK